MAITPLMTPTFLQRERAKRIINDSNTIVAVTMGSALLHCCNGREVCGGEVVLIRLNPVSITPDMLLLNK